MDLTLDKLLRAQHASAEAVQAVADVIAVARGIGDAQGELALAGLQGVKNAAGTLRESAAILLLAAQAVDGIAVLLETHPDEGQH